MKVGDYVRTKDDGYINKITKVNQYNVYVDGRDLFGETLEIPINEIIKSSPNIINLIQVGDYVNGKKVEWIGYDLYRENEDKTLTGIGKKRVLFNEFTKDSVTEKGIKSIVTKEQFESMEYKIGE